jgi:hypothetical protein
MKNHSLMKRPTKEIEQLRKVVKSGVIDPKRIYGFVLPNGQRLQQTGAELLESASVMLDFADCEKRGDLEGMRRAWAKI